MGREIDLLTNYPKPKRNVEERGLEKTESDREIARQFGKEFFDGHRSHGYGGFRYDPKYWQNVIPTFRDHFNLSAQSSVLDVGCAKGFMLFDLRRLIPGIHAEGIDISKYAIENTKEEVQAFVKVADARELPYEDKSFDTVISITTVHNFELEDLSRALREIERVSRGNSFITVDAYRNDEEKRRMFAWNLTAKTILHVEEWKNLFDRVSYTGDYYWFLP